MNRKIKAMFNEETYIELMNSQIRIDEEFVEGMVVEHTGSGIALTNDGKDITSQYPIMLSVAHDEIVKQANLAFELFKIKIIGASATQKQENDKK